MAFSSAMAARSAAGAAVGAPAGVHYHEAVVGPAPGGRVAYLGLTEPLELIDPWTLSAVVDWLLGEGHEVDVIHPGQFTTANTVQNPSYEFPDYGEYTVELRVTDDDANYPLTSQWTPLTFTLEEPLQDPDGDWMTTDDENNIYGTDPNVSDLNHIQNTYTQAGFDDAIQQYLADGTLIANITDYTMVSGQEVRVTVVSVNDPGVANNEGQWGDHLTNQYGMTGTTTFRINNNPKIYSATGYVSMEELVFITLEDLKQAPNPQFERVEWAP